MSVGSTILETSLQTPGKAAANRTRVQTTQGCKAAIKQTRCDGTPMRESLGPLLWPDIDISLRTAAK